MSDGGAAHRVSGSGLLARFSARRPLRAHWARIGNSVQGPLLTLATAIGFDQLARHDIPVLHPFVFLLLTVVYSTSVGGLRPGLISGILTVLYGVHFLSIPGRIFHYLPGSGYTLVGVVLAVTGAIILVTRLRNAAQRARSLELSREEAERLDRRLAFFAEANVVLASSLDYEVTLRDLARLSVPTLADWCAIHVASEQGTLQFVAGAHRDPSKDLLVRALCEYNPRQPPFGAASRQGEIGQVTDEVLQRSAQDSEQLKLFRALAATTFLRIPLHARNQTIGTITLATGPESGRSYGTDDLSFAEELAARASLAVDNGRLFRAAQEADERYGMLFSSNPQPMWVFDVETLAFLAVNEAAVRHYGYNREEFLAMTIMDLLPPEDTPGLHQGLERTHQRGEVALTQHQRKDGTIVDTELVSHEMELDGRRARLVLATDISERTRTRAALHQSEEQLRQAQRMDATGRLAGGVAHDFNNLLTTIRGFSDLLLRDLSSDDKRRKDVEQIRKAADRGALLTRQLLSFGRHQALEPRAIDLNGVVTNMEGLMQRLIGADIKLVTELRQGLGEVQVDQGQLEQVLVNLVLNARDAMPAGGTLTIETGERQISGSTRGRSVKPGRYIVLAVSDTGSGMDGDTLAHVFEPFYTAQNPGNRAGLGLSIVYGIVRQSGGVVRVSSEPGQGTTVKVFLPRSEADETATAATPDSSRGDETVLIVEDEDGVRELLWKILTDHGHTVLEARHGRDALTVAAGYNRPIHLVITDVVMPEMGASELVDQLLTQRPELKVLFISGYTNDEVLRRGVSQSDVAFIRKPFTAVDLMKKVREVLESDRSGAVPEPRH
ncbi:MAG TPA: ATP-binding protein [Gemmatimonadales bacterium]|nr:ATP-binding protein [Gemmatimonadales bacterium]